MNSLGAAELTNRWRLILGKFSEQSLGLLGNSDESSESNESGDSGNAGDYREADDLLDFLYGREYDEERGIRRDGSQDPSQIIIPEWIRRIRSVFPKEICLRLENDALDRYQIFEILTDKKVLESMQPNMNLLKNILTFKDRMKGDVIDTAKNIVRQVAEELTKKLEQDVRRSFSGKINRSESSVFKISKNFDFRKTIIKNLKNYDKDAKRIIPHRVYFNPRIRKYNPWSIIMCVDQSGSMLESVIYSAIMAGIFSRLPILNISMVIFDIEVVDLSGYADDPVDVLMSVQLGGGTNIGKAMEYCEGLIETPKRTIMVLVSDLHDGYGYNPMYNSAKRIIESGAKLFVLTAMDEQSQGMYDENAAKTMAATGAKVASVTPRSLAEWVAYAIK
jgi:Mg-chelatase subunit ChlD